MAQPSTDRAARDASSPALRAFLRARRAGDEAVMRDAWKRLLASEWSAIRFFVARQRSDALPGGRLSEEDRDELTQAVVERLLEKLHFRGDSIGELRAFLRTAAEFTFKDHVRRYVAEDQHRAGSLDEPADGDRGPGTTWRAELDAAGRTIDALEQGELRRIYQEGLAAVDEDKREVVELMLAGWSAAEVAERVGISVDNVYQRNRRGLLQLRGFLKDQL